MILETATIVTAVLIFIRISAMVFALPIFGDSPTPVQVRVLLSLSLTFVMVAAVPAHWGANISLDLLPLALAATRELLFGLCIGLVARMIFDGVIMAASLLGYQMGFGTASLFVPDAGMQMDSFTAFHRIIVILFFLSLNLHHIFINGIMSSFTALPAGQFTVGSLLAEGFIEVSSLIIATALQIAAPVLIALLFSVAALGLIARTVPQLNVFTLSFPVGFFVGLSIYIASLPFFPGISEQLGERIYQIFLITMASRSS